MGSVDWSMVERSRRQELIITMVSERSIHNQKQLLKELSRRGVNLTQSTLSRELKALGIAKGPDGRGGYRYLAGTPAGEEPLTTLSALIQSVSRAKNLVVVKTPPGNAQGVARGVDQAAWSEVMGTIGGDDNILVICPDDNKAARIERRLKAIARL
jgi:transcriptional regulator of arginine metabolism